MGTRGRVSGAALEIATVTPLGAVERAKPPHDLTDEEQVEWVRVVNSLPAEHFTPGDLPLLVQYCRHIISARTVGELKERAAKDMDLQAYDKLLAMQDRESRALAMLATKMRLSQQSTTNHRGNKKTTARKLWES